MAISSLRQAIDSQAFTIQLELPDKQESPSSLFQPWESAPLEMIGASLRTLVTL